MTAQFEFRCLAFHEGLAQGRAPGRLYIDQDYVEFVVGENSGNMSLQGLQLHAEGMVSRKIVLTHPIWRGWAFQTSRGALLQNPFLQSHPSIGFQIDDIRRKRRYGLILWWVILLAVILIPLYLLSRMELVTDRLSYLVPPAWESSLGRLGLEHYRLNHATLDSEQTASLLHPFTEPLLESMPESASHEFVFYLVKDHTPHALALPGGIIIIHTGLIESVGSPDAFMGLLAHEISHVTQQHGVRKLLVDSGLETVIAAVIGDKAGWQGARNAVAPQLLDPVYSARFELEADVYAYNLLKRAQLAASGLHTLFENLTTDDIHDSSAYIKTHPADAQRMEHLRSLVSETIDDDKQRTLATEFELLNQAVRDLSDKAEPLQGPGNAD